MKFLKIMAVIMAVCLLGTALIACDKGGKKNEETTVAAAKVRITLVIKDGSNTVNTVNLTCDGTLRNAIEDYCAIDLEQEEPPFAESTGLLKTVGDLTAADGRGWIAYYEEEGQSEAFKSISEQTLIDGKTVILQLK